MAETKYKNHAAAKRERTASRYLPYTVQVDEGTVRTRNHDLMRIFRIEGIAHESADDEDPAPSGWWRIRVRATRCFSMRTRAA